MSENVDQRWFQWVAGENRGQVVIFDKIETDGEDNYVVFKGGSRCNESLIAQLNANDLTGKFMVEVSDPSNIYQFKERLVGYEQELWEQNADGESVCVQPEVPGRKVIDIIKPKMVAPRASNFGQISNPLPTHPTQPVPQAPAIPFIEVIDSKNSDPVYILMSKSKKVNMSIDLNMLVTLPPSGLYHIAKDSFENGGDRFINHIVDELSIDEIKRAIHSGILQMYETDMIYK